MALGCLGFALVNIVFETTDRFADGPYAEYPSALTVMNWLVVGLKLVGAAVALLSVARRPSLVSPPVMTVLLWGAFATLGVYALGSVVQAIGMALGFIGSAAQIDMAGVAYVLGSLLFAAGFGVLAISYARRYGLERRSVVVGVLGAPRAPGNAVAGDPGGGGRHRDHAGIVTQRPQAREGAYSPTGTTALPIGGLVVAPARPASAFRAAAAID